VAEPGQLHPLPPERSDGEPCLGNLGLVELGLVELGLVDSGGGAGRALWQALLDQSVLVRDCSSWDGLTDCLRVTVGTPAENDRFLAALQTALLARD
jgi:hypothetical protein